MFTGRDEDYTDIQLVVRGRDGENRVVQLVIRGEMKTTKFYS